MSAKTLSERAKTAAYKKVVSYLNSDPEKNIPKILDLLLKYDVKGDITRQVEVIKWGWDQNTNWGQLLRSFFDDVNPKQRQRIFEAAVINGSLIGFQKQKELTAKYKCNMPWAILLDPTSSCNLHCTGCWASEYGDNLNMSLDTLQDIVSQAKELGCYIFVYSGGEPLMRKDDIITLCENNQDSIFLCFTNGTLIDEKFAEDMHRVGNFVPAISIEGFEEATDSRRGKGTFQRVRKAMEILQEQSLIFGVSSCYTSQNYQDIASEEFWDSLIDWGAKFIWLFTYMPVGNDAVPELMVTPDQRRYMYEAVRAYRETKPIFSMDFWNDSEYVLGCIAGGRHYFHINANGDIEPCAFIHYSDSNVYDNTLLEAYRNPLFRAFHDEQPFNQNMLRPCPALDNPEKLERIIEETGAPSTDFISPEDVHDFADKCRLRSKDWGKVADELWEVTKERRPEQFGDEAVMKRELEWDKNRMKKRYPEQTVPAK
jgi:MoaA/NifB/PqqE/SkfB family radical SAM enzyme